MHDSGILWYYLRLRNRNLQILTDVTASTSAPVIPAIYANPQVFDDATVNEAYPPHPLTYSGGTPPVTWQLISGSLGGLSFSDNGVISGVAAASGEFNFSARVTDANSQTASEQYTIQIAAQVGMSSASPPQGIRGTPYSHDFSQYAYGGHPPYTFTDNNNRPSGLTLSTAGVLSGVPDTSQTVTIGITVTDSDGRTGSQTFDITINAAMAITTGSLAQATNGSLYTNSNTPMAASGGSGSYLWSMTGNPSWLSITSTTGALTGTPTATGTHSIVFTVRDAANSNLTATRTISLDVIAATPITIVTSTLGYATVGVSYVLDVSASGGTDPLYYINGTGAFPPGVSMNYETGHIRGTPWDVWSDDIAITVFDSAIPSAYVTTTLPLRAALPVSVPVQTLPTATAGTPYSYQVSSSGGYGTHTYARTTGAFPNGLSISSSGLISGTPTVSGAFSFTITATDSQGRTGGRLLTMLSNSAVQIVTQTLSDGTVGNSYTANVTVSGGVRPFVWSASGPSWVQFPASNSTSTGTLIGTPLSAGPFNVNIRVRDANSVANEANLTLNVTTSTASPPVIQNASPLNGGIVGNLYSPLTFSAIGGTAPYQWAITSGSAGGLTLSSAGVLTGIPTTASAWQFDVRVRDSLAATDTDHFALTIASSAAPPTGDNWVYRAGSGTFPRTAGNGATIVQATRFDTRQEVDNYAELNGTYTSNPGYLLWDTTPAVLTTGATGCMRITIPASGGEPDFRTGVATTWAVGNSYTVGQGVINPVNGRYFGCRVNHVSTSLNHPDDSSDGGDTTEWTDYGNGTNFSDSSVQYVKKLNAEWEFTLATGTASFAGTVMTITAAGGDPWTVGMRVFGTGIVEGTIIESFGTGSGGTGTYNISISNTLSSRSISGDHKYSGYGPGDEFWVAWRWTPTGRLCESRWLHNSGGGGTGSGGWKCGSLASPWRHNIGNGQNFWHHGRYNGGPSVQYIAGGSFANLYDRNQPSSGINGAPSNFAYQPQLIRSHASDHPVTRFTNGATIVDPLTGTSDERSNKRNGHLYFMTDPVRNPAASNRPQYYDPNSGGYVFNRDLRDTPVTFMYHIIFGTHGVADSTVETYIAREGFDWELTNRATDVRLYRYAQNTYSPGAINIAYGNPGQLGVTAMGYGAFWLTFANTGRIRYSNQVGSALDDIYAYMHELVVAKGPIGPAAPGFTQAPMRTTVPSFVPSTPGDIGQLTSVVNGNTTIAAAVPTAWTAGPADIGSSSYGREIFYPWCSGAWDYDHNTWYWSGGGHASSKNSGVYKYEFNGTSSQARGWSLIDGPTNVNSITSTGGALYPADSVDGKVRWAAVHTYNGQCFIRDGRIFRFGGANNTSGGDMNSLVSFNPATLEYINHGGPPTAFGLDSFYSQFCVYDPTYNKIIIVKMNPGSFAVFDPVTNSYSTNRTPLTTAVTGSGGGNASGAYDTDLRRLLIFGSLTGSNAVVGGVVGPYRQLQFNGSTLTQQNVTFSTTTNMDVISAFAPAVCYDPERGCFWAMDLSDGTPTNRAYIWRITWNSSTNLQCERITLDASGTTISQATSGSSWSSLPRGGYGKLVVLKGWDALAVINRADDATYIIRKPS